MRPVAVAILATLLPSCFLVISLICLSIILSTKLRVLRAEYRELQAQKLATTDEPPKAEEREPWSPAPYVIKEESHLSDISNPDWDIDTHATMAFLANFYVWHNHEFNLVFNSPECEPAIEKVLEAIGFQGMTPAVIRKYLQSRETRCGIGRHITTSAMLARTSLNSKPEMSLLPFSPEIQKDLQNFFTALEGIKCKPSSVHHRVFHAI